jgi:hypothetical protein
VVGSIEEYIVNRISKLSCMVFKKGSSTVKPCQDSLIFEIRDIVPLNYRRIMP